MSRSRLPYPVAVKPPSPIRTWSGWPEDVVETLRHWNRGRLSFRGHVIFKCPDCEIFCRPQPHGSGVLDGDTLCDWCLIDRARAWTP